MTQASATNPQAPFSKVIVGSTLDLYRNTMRPVFASLLSAAVKSTLATAAAADGRASPTSTVCTRTASAHAQLDLDLLGTWPARPAFFPAFGP